MAGFKRHTRCDECGSSDAKAVYDDGSSHCFACTHTVPSKEYLEENQGKSKPKKKESMNLEITPSGKPPIAKEEYQEIKDYTTPDVPNGSWRGIRSDISKKFGVRYSVDEDGELLAQYCTITKGGELSGVKVRELPKEFTSVGLTGAECDLFMQFKFNRGGKTAIICEGEVDSLSAYQMMHDYNASRGGAWETAVVSPTTGANSHKQIAGQYAFLDTFEQIILCYDNDKAGQDAAEKVVRVLPKGKVKIMKMRYKDANEYLQKGEQKAFISDFFNSKPYVPVGVVGSGEISSSMREEFMQPKIPLPPFMHKLQKMMAGGVPLGRIINLAAASGIGKSTIIDEIVYHMIFNSPHKVGIVTLESTTGQYGNKLLSRHIGTKLELLTNEEALILLESDNVKEKERELFWLDEGVHRFFLVDDRDGGVDNVKDAIENLIISCGCKVIVCDPVHDIVGTLPLEEQESFYAWQKGMVKSHNVTFYNVMHTRKTPNGQKAGSTGADLNEEDIQGSSAAYKSAAANLIFSRNKEAEDPIERNTTVMKASKIRWTGLTGPAGKYYYDNTTHKVHDLDDWLGHKF